MPYHCENSADSKFLMQNITTQWNQQLNRYILSKLIECLEPNIEK